MPSYHLMNHIYSIFHSRLKVLQFCLLLWLLLLLLLGLCSLFLWDSSQNIHIRCDAYKERSFMHCDSDKNGKVGMYSLQKACKCACFRSTVYFFSSSYLYEEEYRFSCSQKTTIDVNVLSVDRTKKKVNEDRKQQQRHISNRLFVCFFFLFSGNDKGWTACTFSCQQILLYSHVPAESISQF